jgi:TetR/AcrR family transcriptional repressor of nem operon
MRYEKGRKAATRERILEVASRRFRDEGIAAAGLAKVMSDAGLTNGAFYAHFASKEDLVREILEQEIEDQRTVMAAAAAEGGLERIFREYLTAAHRDHRSDGCPSAALLDEIARRPAATRDAYTRRLLGVIDLVAEYLDPVDPGRARADALVIFGTLVGSLQLARAITDPALSAEVLERGIQAALALAGRVP